MTPKVSRGMLKHSRMYAKAYPRGTSRRPTRSIRGVQRPTRPYLERCATTRDARGMTESCPTCGDAFETCHGMKVHHTMTHGESLARETKECRNCGETFEVFRSRSNTGRGKYCSRQCQKEDESRSVECAECGRSMEIQRHRHEKYSRFFCSVECESSWKAANQRGENHHQYDRVEVECHVCGGEMEIHPYRVKSTDRFVCSAECWGGLQSERFSGSSHPRWKGGPVGHYGSEWKSAREARIAKDSGECVVCGLTREKHREKYGQDLEVHHIRPVRTFENPEEAHEIENLRTMCIPCHRTWEGIPVPPGWSDE